MTLDQYAAIGEFVGGIGVIATLVYLALQIRQNTKSVRSSTLAVNSQLWSGTMMNTLDPNILPSYLKGSLGEAELDPESFARFLFTCRAYYVNMENQWYQYQNGTLEEEIYLGYERSLLNQMLAYKGMRRYWKMFSNEFSPEFSDYITKLLTTVPENPPTHMYEEWIRLTREEKADKSEQ